MNRRSQMHPRIRRRSLLIVVLALGGVTAGMLPAQAHAAGAAGPAVCQKTDRALGVTGEQVHDDCAAYVR